MLCDYCKKEIKPKEDNGTVGCGFFDGDTKKIVCWDCQSKHYTEKSKTKYADLYTEFPLIIKNSASGQDLRSKHIR